MKLFLLILGSLAILLWGFWLFAVPTSVIEGRIEAALKKDPITAEVTFLKKGYFYDFTADLAIRRAGRNILTIEQVAARINPFSLIVMELPLTFQGAAGSGKISGQMNLIGNSRMIRAELDGMQIENQPFLAAIGLTGKGRLTGNFSMERQSGEITFAVNDLSLTNWKVEEVTLPLEFFRAARGAVAFGPDAVTITAFTLEGDGIYARIKGNIVRGQADLTMELMPEKTFMAKTPIMLLLENYRVSPGYYAIPIKKSLS